MSDFDAIILGAGAAGLMCAARAWQRGKRVLVLEKAERPGMKILISGGGRCNFTNLGVGPANYLSLLVNRARMQGMVVFDYAARYGEAAREMGGWLADGRLQSRVDIVEGFDTFPDALLKLFRGENTGKLLLKIG